MKVAISSTGKDLEADIDPRFGRCRYFLIVETESLEFEVFDNESISLSGGAGIQAAEFVASKGAAAVITGNCGPNAVKVLTAAGVKLYHGQSGPARQALEVYLNGKLDRATEANVSDHFGIGGGRMSIQGSGGNAGDWAPGRGMGKGRGCGRGMGRNIGNPGRDGLDFPVGTASSGNEKDLQTLKQKANELRLQIEDLESRIRNLEQG